MAKRDAIRLEAKVIDALPNAVFRVELEGGHGKVARLENEVFGGRAVAVSVRSVTNLAVGFEQGFPGFRARGKGCAGHETQGSQSEGS